MTVTPLENEIAMETSDVKRANDILLTLLMQSQSTVIYMFDKNFFRVGPISGLLLVILQIVNTDRSDMATQSRHCLIQIRWQPTGLWYSWTSNGAKQKLGVQCIGYVCNRSVWQHAYNKIYLCAVKTLTVNVLKETTITVKIKHHMQRLVKTRHHFSPVTVLLCLTADCDIGELACRDVIDTSQLNPVVVLALVAVIKIDQHCNIASNLDDLLRQSQSNSCSWWFDG